MNGEPVGRLEFQQPLDCETISIQDIFGLDNGEHLRNSASPMG